jgi:cyclohexanone monooxygenase
MGANIPGKKAGDPEYPRGLPLYLQKCEESRAAQYAGFI